jgi:ubiquinone/menaquinone biosynthesis C-methylase UbiE
MEQLVNLENILNKIPIWEGISVADFGSGSGIFTIELAKRLNNNGHILAIDILEKPLAFLMENAKRQNVAHLINTKTCDLENKNLGRDLQSGFDVVTAINMLFQVKDKEGVFKEAKRVLRDNGFLVIVDWEIYKIPMSENLYPVQKKELIKNVEKIGFELKEEIRISNTHFGLIFTKK